MSAWVQEAKPLIREAVRLIEESCVIRRDDDCVPSARRQVCATQQSAAPSFSIRPNANRDLAARVAFALAVRAKRRVGYLVFGETPVCAVMRMWLLAANVSCEDATSGDIAEIAFPKLTRTAAVIANSYLWFRSGEIRREHIRQVTNEFVRGSHLEFLVVDDVECEALRQIGVPPELDGLQIRREFAEAVRKLSVTAILPGCV